MIITGTIKKAIARRLKVNPNRIRAAFATQKHPGLKGWYLQNLLVVVNKCTRYSVTSSYKNENEVWRLIKVLVP